jgi:hypothetical protein
LSYIEAEGAQRKNFVFFAVEKNLTTKYPFFRANEKTGIT